MLSRGASRARPTTIYSHGLTFFDVLLSHMCANQSNECHTNSLSDNLKIPIDQPNPIERDNNSYELPMCSLQ